jgi:hypothetical protein
MMPLPTWIEGEGEVRFAVAGAGVVVAFGSAFALLSVLF